MSVGHDASCFYGEGKQKEITHEKHTGTLTLTLSLFYASVIPRGDLK